MSKNGVKEPNLNFMKKLSISWSKKRLTIKAKILIAVIKYCFFIINNLISPYKNLYYMIKVIKINEISISIII